MLEMTTERPGVVLSMSVSDPDVEVVAVSLAASMHASAGMAEAGIPFRAGSAGTEYDAWRERRRSMLDAANDHFGWEAWPYDRIIAREPAGWPAHWRAASGLPPETDYPHPPARPIADVLADAAGNEVMATVEGLLTGRMLFGPGETADKCHSMVTVSDGSGSMHVLVEIGTGGSWAAWLGRRIQVDVRVGPSASRHAKALLDQDPRRAERAPEGPWAVAISARDAVQT